MNRFHALTRTRRGHFVLGALIILGIYAFNHFLNSIWSYALVIAVLAIVGQVQHFRARRVERSLRS